MKNTKTVRNTIIVALIIFIVLLWGALGLMHSFAQNSKAWDEPYAGTERIYFRVMDDDKLLALDLCLENGEAYDEGGVYVSPSRVQIGSLNLVNPYPPFTGDLDPEYRLTVYLGEGNSYTYELNVLGEEDNDYEPA